MSGTAGGDTIEAMLEFNGGDRVVRLRGLRVADRIELHQTVELVRGEFSGRVAASVAHGPGLPRARDLALEGGALRC